MPLIFRYKKIVNPAVLKFQKMVIIFYQTFVKIELSPLWKFLFAAHKVNIQISYYSKHYCPDFQEKCNCAKTPSRNFHQRAICYPSPQNKMIRWIWDPMNIGWDTSVSNT